MYKGSKHQLATSSYKHVIGENLVRFFRFEVLYFKRTDCDYKPLRSSTKDLTEVLESLPRRKDIRFYITALQIFMNTQQAFIRML